MKIEQVLKELRSFDMYYEMSDSHSVWQAGTTHKKKIQSMLSELNMDEKVKIVESLAPTPERQFGHDVLVRYFVESFDGIKLAPSNEYKKDFCIK